MIEETARHVVDRLRERGVPAHLAETGVFAFGVRVEVGDGREALWGVGGAAGLSAEVLLDGDLVGLVAEIPGSADFDVAAIADAIARADYSSPEGHERGSAGPDGPALPVEGGLLRRFQDDFREAD